MSSAKKVVHERPNHFRSLQALREQHDFCDVTIEVGCHKIRAHRVILANMTNYFQKLLGTDFNESNKHVMLKDVSEENIQAIIEFCYTGQIIITAENSTNLLKDADVLELDDVKQTCAEYLESNIDVKNVCEVVLLAQLLPECDSLLKCSIEFIRENLQDVSLTDAFTDLDFEILKAILSENLSRISPELVPQVIMEWASDDIEKKKNHVLKLFRYVPQCTESIRDYFLKDRFKNILGSKHSEFVKEILSIWSAEYYEPIKAEHFSIKSEFYISVHGLVPHCVSYLSASYDVTTEMWNNEKLIPFRDTKMYREAIVYQDKLYAFSSNDVSIMYICDFDDTIRTYTEIEIPFDSRCARLALLDDCLYACGVEDCKIWRFSLASQKWETIHGLRNMPNCSQLVVLQGQLYAVGGYLGLGNMQKIQKYDAETDNWTFICEGNLPYVPAIVGLNDKIYVCGGCDHNALVHIDGVEKGMVLESVIAYDLTEEKWTEVASMDTARFGQAAVAHEGKIWVFGGFNVHREPLKTVEVYDSSTNSWSYGKPMAHEVQWPEAFIYSTNW